MSAITKRKIQAAWERELRDLRADNERCRIMLEVPRGLAEVWRLCVLRIDKFSERLDLIDGLEGFIRTLALEDWGPGTLVIFNRSKAKVIFAHADGRRITYPVESKMPEIKGKPA